MNKTVKQGNGQSEWIARIISEEGELEREVESDGLAHLLIIAE